MFKCLTRINASRTKFIQRHALNLNLKLHLRCVDAIPHLYILQCLKTMKNFIRWTAHQSSVWMEVPSTPSTSKAKWLTFLELNSHKGSLLSWPMIIHIFPNLHSMWMNKDWQLKTTRRRRRKRRNYWIKYIYMYMDYGPCTVSESKIQTIITDEKLYV